MRLRTKLYYSAAGGYGSLAFLCALGHGPLLILAASLIMTGIAWGMAECLLSQDYPQTKPEEKKDGE